jgi:hypothetical protein
MGPRCCIARSCRISQNLLALALFCAVSYAGEPHWDIQYRYRQFDSSLTINDIAFPSATRGIVCGYLTSRNDGKEHPVVLLTGDGGQTWTETPVKEAGISLFFLDDSTGWMVAEKGIWSTAESGHSWTRLNKAPAGMLKVWFLDKKRGFAAGLKKRVFETSDGGATWTPLPVLKEVAPADVTFVDIAFKGNNGIITGTQMPSSVGQLDWMEPENASRRRQTPAYSVLLETTDAGKTWFKSEASLFGQATRITMTSQGSALGLFEFREEFEYPSEVYSIKLGGGGSTRVYRSKDVAVTSVRLFDGSDRGVIVGYQPPGSLHRSPVPGKLKVLASDDREHWSEMEVDYRAVAHQALIAGPDQDHLWIATDTGTILKLVAEQGWH